MIKKGLLFLFLYTVVPAKAETIKTDVLVIGGTEGGTAAAIQAARSKLKTVLIEPGTQLGGWPKSAGQVIISGNKDLPSGIWGEFRKNVIRYYSQTKGYDTTANAALKFEPYSGSSILKKITDTVKNLTVKLNTNFTSIKKDGTGWDVNISQGGQQFTVKTRVLIDATPLADAAKILGALAPTGHINGLVTLTVNDVYSPYQRQVDLYRTSIAAVEPAFNTNGKPAPPFGIPLGTVVAKGIDNLIIISAAIDADPFLGEAITSPAVQMCIGQGAGTIAAYCAFYKTTTKNFNVKTVRTIQGELLDFKGYLIPFSDIPATDPNIRAIQQIGATGLLEGKRIKDERTNEISNSFLPDTLVRTAEIKAGLNELYTRAFLWFNKAKPGEYYTVGDLLSFISEITLREPKTFQLDMQKQWQPVYRFKTTFDIKNPVTRREFAVLANKFLNPFARYVDITGRLVN